MSDKSDNPFHTIRGRVVPQRDTVFGKPKGEVPGKRVSAEAKSKNAIQRILEEYNYEESNIPVNHEYWSLKRRK